MIWLILLWFICWCLVRIVKTEPAVLIILIVGIVLALLLVFGLPHISRA